MRVFVAGASGAVGRRLVPRLAGRGHEVVGAFKSPGSTERVRALGAEPVVLDLLDSEAVQREVTRARPDAIIHQATALAGKPDFKHMDRFFAQTNLLRTKGTDALLEAAKRVGARRFVAQSYASYRYVRAGGFVKSEEDPLDPDPPQVMRGIYGAMDHLDSVVTQAGGVALRYGGLYGDASDGLVDAVRRRMFPVVGDGGAYTSFTHLDDAAEATVLAMEQDVSGIYNIVDDEPAPMREWLPYLAGVIGAKPPRHFPAWLARVFAGDMAVMMGTEMRGASNAKAKRELGWTPSYPSWRQGFVSAYGAPPKTAPSLSGPKGEDRPEIAGPTPRQEVTSTRTGR